MKVYVSQLPKNCIYCPCESEYYCNLLNRDIESLELIKGCKDCPLQSLSDYTKQVRKEVCEEIKAKAYQDSEFYDLENGGISERKTYLINEHILDQIQGKGE